jgi:Protein of unknown function (DUF742)
MAWPDSQGARPGGTDPGPFLRPYAMTEGRTEPTGPDLAIEDLVGSPAGAAEPPSWLSLEHQSIAMACRETLSVAELASRLDLPLGVTRVLVGDLAQQGMVTVHRAPSHAGGPNVALLEQVLHGLQQL